MDLDIANGLGVNADLLSPGGPGEGNGEVRILFVTFGLCLREWKGVPGEGCLVGGVCGEEKVRRVHCKRKTRENEQPIEHNIKHLVVESPVFTLNKMCSKRLCTLIC